MSWSRARQLKFIFTFLLILAVIFSGLYFVYRPQPTCSDNKQNGTELGVDCGGTCSKACVNQLVVPTPTIWWKRVFSSGAPGKYDVAALVENQNAHFGTGRIAYIFRLYDKNDVLLAEKAGATFFNPQEKFVIYEPNVDTGAREPVKTFLYFDNKAVWQRVKFVPPALSIGAKTYAGSPKPALSAKATNESLELLRGTKFVAVLSDGDGNALAASQTVLDTLAPNETKVLNFTWLTPFTAEPAVKDIFPKLNLFDETNFE